MTSLARTLDFDALDRMVLAAVAPSFGLALLFLAGRVLPLGGDQRRRLASLVLLVTFATLPTVSTPAFRTFPCRDFDGGIRVLEADYGVSCRGRRYGLFRLFAAIVVALWPVGVPLSIFVYLRRRRRALDPTAYAADALEADALSRARSNDADLAASAFLWASYRPPTYYWECVDMGRRVLLTGGVVFAGSDATRCFAGLAIALAFLLLMEMAAPYADPGSNALGVAGAWQVACSFLILFLCSTRFLDVPRVLLGFVALVANLAVLAGLSLSRYLEEQRKRRVEADAFEASFRECELDYDRMMQNDIIDRLLAERRGGAPAPESRGSSPRGAAAARRAARGRRERRAASPRNPLRAVDLGGPDAGAVPRWLLGAATGRAAMPTFVDYGAGAGADAADADEAGIEVDVGEFAGDAQASETLLQGYLGLPVRDLEALPLFALGLDGAGRSAPYVTQMASGGAPADDDARPPETERRRRRAATPLAAGSIFGCGECWHHLVGLPPPDALGEGQAGAAALDAMSRAASRAPARRRRGRHAVAVVPLPFERLWLICVKEPAGDDGARPRWPGWAPGPRDRDELEAAGRLQYTSATSFIVKAATVDARAYEDARSAVLVAMNARQRFREAKAELRASAAGARARDDARRLAAEARLHEAHLEYSASKASLRGTAALETFLRASAKRRARCLGIFDDRWPRLYARLRLVEIGRADTGSVLSLLPRDIALYLLEFLLMRPGDLGVARARTPRPRGSPRDALVHPA
ncbi:hypothetical protein JL720_14416 [Aureococcus anophagefferens]|nr:hypothetical protein JL720_14416 [Aureococcus anophagefferens]